MKHTEGEHPDRHLLLAAAREIHDLATKIDHVEQETGLSEQMLQRLREIEAIVQGLDDVPFPSSFSYPHPQPLSLVQLVSEERVFYRYDLVSVEAEGGRKERCIFLFSDQLLITSLKRKAGPALKRTTRESTLFPRILLLPCPTQPTFSMYPMGHNFLENHKFKLLMKISLDDLEIKCRIDWICRSFEVHVKFNLLQPRIRNR